MTDSILLHDSLDALDSSEHRFFEVPKIGSLSKVQGIALLTRLVEDVLFRTRFEQSPADALAELGVPALQIATLRPACLSPRPLAHNDVLKATQQRLSADLDSSVLSFVIPTLKLNEAMA